MGNRVHAGRPEAPPATCRFTRQLVSANRLADRGFSEWLFYPGMFFLDKNKWWANSGLRAAPHEGVDLCFYRTAAGEHRRLAPRTRVPAVADGEVLAVIDDFLGKSIIIHHRGWKDAHGRVCTIFGHTEPPAGLSPGDRVIAGEPVARLADALRTGGPGPHLHVSLALVDRRLSGKDLSWPTLSGSASVLFLDPLPLLTGDVPRPAGG